MQQQSISIEEKSTVDQNPAVEEFLEYLGELIAQNYIQRMEIASQKFEHINNSEK